MIEAVIEGIVSGLFLTIFIGPVFMFLIEVSIKKGVRQALFVDLGVFISDVTAIIISKIFLDQLTFLSEEKATTGIIAGSIFIVFGFGYIFKRKKTPEPKSVDTLESDKLETAETIISQEGHVIHKATSKQQAMNVLKGFLLNLINPSVLVYWLGVMLFAVREFGEAGDEIFAYFTALLITFFSLDVLKIVGASKLRRFLKPKIIEKINIFSGIAFMVLGAISLIAGLINL